MISVVVPIYNEKDNILALLEEIVAVAAQVPVWEILYVDDCSNDGSFELLKSLKEKIPMLRVLRHEKQSGQSAGLWTGINAATQELVATLDGDGQNDPADIKLLYDKYMAQTNRTHKVMVLGERKKRNDNWVRRASSRIANKIRSGLLKDSTKDTGCSLKLFRREDYLRLPYFDHMHRFLPALMLREGVQLVHVDVSHRARLHGVSKYGTLDRLLVGISDIFGVLWLIKRARRADQFHEEAR